MVHFEDLAEARYHRGTCDPANWASPLLAVGWLEHSHPFPSGVISDEFVEKLLSLHQGFRDYTSHHFLGLHTCSLCEADGRQGLALAGSQVNLFVPGKDEVFFAPGRVDHYIVEHGYVPPAPFVSAVLACPEPGSDAFRRVLRRSNRGIDPPGVDRFHRDGGRNYVTVPRLARPEAILAAERSRLIGLGYGRALPVQRFDSMMARLAASYAEDAPFRSFAGWVDCEGEMIWVRVEARTPFAARAFIMAEFGECQSFRVFDETKPQIRYGEKSPRLTVPSIPFSEDLLEVAYARLIERDDPHGRGLNEPYLERQKARMKAEYSKEAAISQFLGEINIDDQVIEFSVAARTRFEAEIAMVVEFGDGRIFSIDHGGSTQTEDEAVRTGDVVDVSTLPFSDSNLALFYRLRTDRSKFALSDEESWKIKTREAERYKEDAPLKEYIGYVVAGVKKTHFRVMARSRIEAQAAVAAEFGDFHTSTVRKV